MGQRRREARDVYFTDHSVVCDTHRLHLIVPVRPVSSLSLSLCCCCSLLDRIPSVRHPLRWAQFFICPLMIRDAIDREVEAVDSGECISPGFLVSLLPLITVILSCRPEYQLARPSDSHRKEMLFGSLAKPGHPMGKFCWGEFANTTAGTLNPHRASSGYVQQEQTRVLRQLPGLLLTLIFQHIEAVSPLCRSCADFHVFLFVFR